MQNQQQRAPACWRYHGDLCCVGVRWMRCCSRCSVRSRHCGCCRRCRCSRHCSCLQLQTENKNKSELMTSRRERGRLSNAGVHISRGGRRQAVRSSRCSWLSHSRLREQGQQVCRGKGLRGRWGVLGRMQVSGIKAVLWPSRGAQLQAQIR